MSTLPDTTQTDSETTLDITPTKTVTETAPDITPKIAPATTPNLKDALHLCEPVQLVITKLAS